MAKFVGSMILQEHNKTQDICITVSKQLMYQNNYVIQYIIKSSSWIYLPIFLRFVTLAREQSYDHPIYDCPIASEVTLKYMGKIDQIENRWTILSMNCAHIS